MQHSPSLEANVPSARQEIPHVLLTQCSQLHPPHFPQGQPIESNPQPSNSYKRPTTITLQRTVYSSKWLLSSGFPTKTLYTFLPPPTMCHKPRAPHHKAPRYKLESHKIIHKSNSHLQILRAMKVTQGKSDNEDTRRFVVPFIDDFNTQYHQFEYLVLKDNVLELQGSRCVAVCTD